MAVLFLAHVKESSTDKNFFGLNRMTWQILILVIISASPLQDNLFRAVRMTCVYVLLPFGWAYYYKKHQLAEFGITRKKLIPALILGLAVYSIALLAFLLSLGNPSFDAHFRWGGDYTLTDWLLIMALVSWMAFVTDLWTRGFVLMLLAKYQSPGFGILVQNVTWLLVHLYEIAILGPSMGVLGALGLTLVLGVLGDLVALRTKNIIGLGVGHMYLNIAFFGYVRFLG